MTSKRTHPFQSEADQIQAFIDNCEGNSDEFVALLHKRNVSHISFSQIYAYETCPYQYYLRYILGKEITPVPEYFIKGKALHRTIANVYRALNEGRESNEETICFDGIDRFSQAGVHIRNAFLTFQENKMLSDEILGIEKPFVFLIDGDIPPVVGVIDLILRRGETLIMIDHKTGRDFYQPDILQMAIYLHHIRVDGFEGECEFYYDSYRWVQNLASIRKPAFDRKQMKMGASEVKTQLMRLAAGYHGIRNLRNGQIPERNGECFRCNYRNIC